MADAYVATVAELERYFSARGDRVISIPNGFQVTREHEGVSRTVQVVWSRRQGIVSFEVGTELGVVPEGHRDSVARLVCRINSGLPIPGFVLGKRLAFRTAAPLDHDDCLSTELANRFVDYAMRAVAENLRALAEAVSK